MDNKKPDFSGIDLANKFHQIVDQKKQAEKAAEQEKNELLTVIANLELEIIDLYDQYPALENQVKEAIMLNSKFQEAEDKQFELYRLNYLLEAIKNGQSITTEETLKAEEYAQSRQESDWEKLLDDMLGESRFTAVSRERIKIIRKHKNQISKLVRPDWQAEEDKSEAKIRQTNLNSYWGAVENGQDKKATIQFVILLQKIRRSNNPKQTAWDLLADKDEDKNRTLEEISQNTQNKIVKLKSQIKDLQTEKERLKKALDIGGQANLAETVQKRLEDLDLQIQAIKNEMLEIKAQKNNSAESLELKEGLIHLPQTKDLATQEIPQTWDELGQRFDKIPDKYFTKFRTSRDKLEIWKSQGVNFNISLGNILYICVFPCARVNFTPKYKLDGERFQLYNERCLSKILSNYPSSSGIKFTTIKDLSEAYLELKNFFKENLNLDF